MINSSKREVEADSDGNALYRSLITRHRTPVPHPLSLNRDVRRHVNPISSDHCVVTTVTSDIYELISTSPPVVAFLPAAFLSKMAFLSASSFKLVMTTLEGWIPIWTVAP